MVLFYRLKARFLVAGLLGLLVLLPALPVSAACDALASDKGQITKKVDTEGGKYTLWLRMLTPAADKSSVFVKVDEACAITAGEGKSSDAFRWVDYQGSDTAKKMTFDLDVGTHVITLAGRDVGAGVDKAMLISDGCVPVDFGLNCAESGAGTKPKTTGTGKGATEQANVPASVHRSNYVLLGLSIVAILGTVGFVVWKYRRFAKDAPQTFDQQSGVVIGGGAPQSGSNISSFIAQHRLILLVCGIVVCASGVLGFVAATSHSPQFEAEDATLSGGTKVIEDAKASANKYVTFNMNGTPGTHGGSSSSSSSSGGSSSGSGGSSGGDSGGGSGDDTYKYLYPARYSVGAPGVARYRQSDATLPVPAGYTEVFPSDNTSKEWDLYNCSGTTNLDHMYIHAFIYIGTACHGTLNITNSIIAPPPGSTQRAILVNADSSDTLAINISDTTVRPEPVPLGGTNAALTDHIISACDTCSIHLNRIDVANSGGMCLCGHDTIVEHSWLHDHYNAHLADPGLAHTGGVFPYGDHGPLTVRYNRLEPGVDAYTGLEHTNYWKSITAVLFTQSNAGSVLQNYDVHDNFLSLGGYDAAFEDGINMIFKNNVLGPNHFDYVGTCSPGNCTISFADWSGNVVGDIAGNPTSTVVNHP